MNVLAHVADPGPFLAACRDRLKLGGVVLIQPSQARMFGNYEFDTCYHEHISFFNTRSMSALAKSVGLQLMGTVLVKVHGDSPIYMLGRPGELAVERLMESFGRGHFSIAEDLSEYEKKIRLYDWETYDKFRDSAHVLLRRLADEVQRRRQHGFEVVFVGAAAKAMTVLNAGDIKPDRFLDENPLKIGTYAPGIGTLIEDLRVCSELTRPTFFVITAWNFREELATKLRSLGVPKDSVFYSYFPRTEVF